MDPNQPQGYPPQQPPQGYPPPPPPMPPPMPPGSYPGKGMCIASMVLGICSLVIPYVGTATAIVGLILGIMGKKKASEVGAPTGMGTAGIVMSIIGLIGAVIVIIICIGICGAAASAPYYW